MLVNNGLILSKQQEYTLLEVFEIIKQGESYVPVKRHSLIKRIYQEGNSIQFEFYKEVPHVGLGISKDMVFYKQVNHDLQVCVSFELARRSGKLFKYKDWDWLYSLLDVLHLLKEDYTINDINRMLDEEAWIIKEDPNEN